MMRKQKRREKKGITLIALVITIIVLLILAGVTLNIMMDQNGIVNKTKEAATKWNIAAEEENNTISHLGKFLNDEYVAKIDDKYYESLQLAIEDVPMTNEETKIELLNNTWEELEILENQNVNLELNGYEVGWTIVNNGLVKINNGELTGDGGEWTVFENNGMVEMYNVKYTSCIMNNSNALIIEDSEISGRSDYKTISSSNSCVIKNSTINGGIRNYGTMKIGDTEIRMKSAVNEILHNREGATLELYGNTILSFDYYQGRANLLRNDGYLEIRDNTNFDGSNCKVAITNDGTLKAIGGIITAMNYAIVNDGSAEITEDVICQPRNSGTITIIQNLE